MSNEGFSTNPRTPSQEALAEAVRRLGEQRFANPAEEDEEPKGIKTEETDEERRERILDEADKAAQKADKAYRHKPPFWIEKDN